MALVSSLFEVKKVSVFFVKKISRSSPYRDVIGGGLEIVFGNRDFLFLKIKKKHSLFLGPNMKRERPYRNLSKSECFFFDFSES